MFRTIRLLTCLLLILALVAAPAALASPADSASSPWWTALSELWNKVFAAATGADGGTSWEPEIDPDGPALTNSDTGDGETTPEIDPDGTALTNSDTGDGETTPEIDPNGLTAYPRGDGSRGAEIPGNHGKTTFEIERNG